ncbi:Pre-mRNA-splicing factor SPF27 [Formica fusca]
MAGEVIVDALPYIDQGYDEPGVREAALAMVEEETRRYRPTKNYLEHLQLLNITAFETEVMKHEFERMQNRLPMEVLSMKRYELPPPPSGKLNDLAAWNESVENSSAQLEHQATRICNLELMMGYGCEAWKSYLEVLVQLVGQAQKQMQTLRKMIQEVNWQRKSMQTQGGDKLRALEAQWVGLVSKNYEIEQACVHLEEEIQKIMMNKEAVEINDVPAEEGPDVPEKSATEAMAIQMQQQENQET